MYKTFRTVAGGVLVMGLAGCAALNHESQTKHDADSTLTGNKAGRIATEVVVNIASHQLQPGTTVQCEKYQTGKGTSLTIQRAVGRSMFEGTVNSDKINLCDLIKQGVSVKTNISPAEVDYVELRKDKVQPDGTVTDWSGLTALEKDQNGTWTERHHYNGEQGDNTPQPQPLAESAWQNLVTI